MAENINIQLINPVTFEYQNYLSQDTSLITNFEISTTFDSKKDIIEYFIYNLNNEIVYLNNNYPDYRLIDNNLTLDPGENLTNAGFNEGNFNTVYNFLSPLLASSFNNNYFISQISSDRTELRLDTTVIPNELVISSSQELISDIQNSTGSYYDFYLNFGENQLIIANNALLDTSSIDNPTILIKLYEALPPQFDINSQLWVVTQIAEPIAYNIDINQIFDVIDSNIYLKGPNFNLGVSNQINNSTAYVNYTSLTSPTSSYAQGTGSLQYQLNNILAQQGIKINIDYSDYSNFIHFSSAQTRLENFYYKLQLLEEYTYSASLSDSSSSGAYYVSSSNILWQNKIDEIITGFDGYEYYLYYESGSTCWPKTGNTPPYTNVTTNSVTGLAWFTSQLETAENYDSENNNALVLAIPSYIKEDSDNYQFELFVEMVGQMFDNVFVYLQNITTKFDADNRLNYGVSKDLVADVLRDAGINIYQNNFSSNDVYQALIGITPSGSLYNLPFTTTQYPVPTGSFLEYITTYVTASSTSSLMPTDDLNKEQYKRIYHNLPYLLKKKGTVAGLRTLINTFGVSDTILRINEFGGKDKNASTYDNWQNTYDYKLDFNGSTSKAYAVWNNVNSIWDTSVTYIPSSFAFRFKTEEVTTTQGPTSPSQSLVSLLGSPTLLNNTNVILSLTYSGSLTSGSYSGSIPTPYYQYGTLTLYPDYPNTTNTASIDLPFYDGGWWSVLVNSGSSEIELIAKNKNYKGEDGNTIGFQASASVVPSTANWSGGNSNFAMLGAIPSGSGLGWFTGSMQELRYYAYPLSQSAFDAYVMNPNSVEGNSIDEGPNQVIFRASLGGELYTGSVSIHPKVTGSWIPTASFESGFSNFDVVSASFSSNTEVMYFDQVPAGIQNAISQKIKQQNIVLPYSSSNTNIPNANTLSPFISVQQTIAASESYTRDIDYVEIAFSPQNEINEDINSSLGYFNIGEYIGDPRFQSSSLDTYPDLDVLRNRYFEKYTHNYQEWDYIRLIEFFNNYLFKIVQDWTPARTSLASGIVIKNTLLDRNRYRVPQVNTSESLAMVGSGSTNVPYVVEDQTIIGSIDSGFITGSNGGSMPNLLGQTSSVYTYPGAVNITQSWTGSTPSVLGIVSFTESSQTEFYDGELSGSNLVVTTGSLNNPNDGFLVLENNELISRPNNKYLDVDFSSNAITAVNEQAILSGSATPATVPDSYYTTARITNPRYNGSRSTSPGFNLLPVTGSTIGQLSNVGSLGSYFIYFDWIGSTNPEYKKGYNIHVKFMVDELGNIINPSNISSSYYYNLIDSYLQETTPILYMYNTAGSSGGTNKYPVYKPGVEISPIVYTDSGSLGDGSFSSIDFNNGASTVSVTSFWTTGSSSPSVLTSSTNLSIVGPISLASVYENGNPPYSYGFESSSYEQVPINGTGFNDPLPFTILPYDEFRVSGSENLVWTIISSSHDYTAGVSTNLYLFLDRPYTGSYPPDYFTIRRYVPNPNLVIINTTSSIVNAAGATGFLLPEYPSQLLDNNFDNIVQDLSSKNLI